MLREVAIPACGRTKTEIAQLLGISRQSLHGILAGRQAITPDVAVRLGKLFGNGPKVWLYMQQAYDLWHAERKLAETLRGMPTLRAA